MSAKFTIFRQHMRPREGGGWTTKVAYRSVPAAVDAREQMCRRHPDGKTLEVYQCEVCGLWHLGNSPKERAATLVDNPLYIELGARAFWNLESENHGRRERRLTVIGTRWRRIKRLANAA